VWWSDIDAACRFAPVHVIDDVAWTVDGDPAERARVTGSTSDSMLVSLETEVRRLQPQSGIVGHEFRWTMNRLTESCSNDSVVRLVDFQAMFDEKVALDAIEFDLDRGLIVSVEVSRF
jgi:hypothetical protein